MSSMLSVLSSSRFAVGVRIGANLSCSSSPPPPPLPSPSPFCSPPPHRHVGLVVKASALRAEDPGFETRLRRDFSESSHTSYFKIDTPVATLPGAWRFGSVLGLVGPLSVYCDLARRKVGSATSISVWQHIKISEQIRL